MIEGDPLVLGESAAAELKDYLRVQGSHEDALIGHMLGSAAGLCEAFTGEMLLARGVSETIAATGAWTKLGRRPVRAILGVEGLAAGDYATDIDAAGTGWVRVTASGVPQVRVSYSCGLAAGWSDAPEALRQGIIRLAAHLYTHRSGAEDAGPPAAVTALWRPYRRLRIG
jgi:uncharacterized phiE125 gp8 family phage protein